MNSPPGNSKKGSGDPSRPAVLLDLSDVCNILRCGRRKAWELAASGKLKPVRVGRLLRFRPEDVEAFVRRGGSR